MDAFERHVQRAMYQTAIWCHSHFPKPLLWSPVGKGWIVSNGAIKSPLLDGSELFWWHKRGLQNIKPVVLMLGLIGVKSKHHFLQILINNYTAVFFSFYFILFFTYLWKSCLCVGVSHGCSGNLRARVAKRLAVNITENIIESMSNTTEPKQCYDDFWVHQIHIKCMLDASIFN